MDIQNSEMIIKLNSSNSDVIVTMTAPNGRVVEKCVSVDDLMASLASRHTMSTGLLPSNTRFFKGDQNNYVAVLESPAKLRTFSLHSNAQAYEQGDRYKPRQLTVPFPNCVIVFKVSGRRIRNTWVYTTANKISSMDDTLSMFPFGNVYQDSHVCWGQVNLPEINSPINLSAVLALFFDAPFNGDLTGHRTWTRPAGLEIGNDFWSLVNHLDGQSSFPSTMLYSSGINLNSAIQTASR